LSSPYVLQENDAYSYEFITDLGITYSIYFLDYSYMFEEYPSIAKNVFTFNIDVISGAPDEAIGDERIGSTVFHVFKVFFEKIENVAVYVCDTLDERHLARKRKFDLWFWKFNDGSILKEDGIAVIEGTPIYNLFVRPLLRIHSQRYRTNKTRSFRCGLLVGREDRIRKCLINN
jgi:hypothetical protein